MLSMMFEGKCTCKHFSATCILRTFFTFLTSPTRHLSMVKLSEKKSMLENFHINVLKASPAKLRDKS